MNIITRELKNYVWSFDEDQKVLTLYDKINQEGISIDKIRMFSLFRFLIRISQRMSRVRRKKKVPTQKRQDKAKGKAGRPVEDSGKTGSQM